MQIANLSHLSNCHFIHSARRFKMPFRGCVVVIKRTGVDGSVFPLVTESCLLGRNENCDIRVQLPAVAGEHCKISVNENKQVRLMLG